jgi:8-oxo-dGTP pyrophosphatase MutT (NUDIX family)
MTTQGKSSKEKQRRPGAGFVVLRKFSDGWKVLGLRFYSTYDLPKGGIDYSDEPLLTAAKRECFEECDISVDDAEMPWGDLNLKLRHLTLYIAVTDKDPKIKKNLKTGIVEHHGLKWLDLETDHDKFHPYLRPAVIWARDILKSTEDLY